MESPLSFIVWFIVLVMVLWMWWWWLSSTTLPQPFKIGLFAIPAIIGLFWLLMQAGFDL